ncbi:MAG TPA: hypothetical protein VKQ28_00720 [Candidatus Acidoferrum sp.]|nr:hypothetical protein [Candidatus Acidoferrum sp.]
MRKTELARKIVKHLKARENGKKSYKEAEQLLDEIAQHARSGQEIALPGGRKAVLKDLYLTTNKVFRAHGIGRYEIEVVEA